MTAVITRIEHEVPATSYTTLEVELEDGSSFTAQQMPDGSVFVSNAISMLNLNITLTDSPVLRALLEAAEQEFAATPEASA